MIEEDDDYRMKVVYIDPEPYYYDSKPTEDDKRFKKKAKKDEKLHKKLFKEVVNKNPTKRQNLNLQKILQFDEYYHGKHLRALEAIDWLQAEFERWKYYDTFTEKEEETMIERLKFLKKMSFMAGDVYHNEFNKN